MISDITIDGVYFPSLLVLGFGAVMLTGILSRILQAAGFYRYVAYRPLVDLAVFVLLLGLAVLLSSGTATMNQFLTSLSRWLLTGAIVVIAVFVALWIWQRYETEPWTRDGHVRADVLRVASDVGGLVTSVAVHDNQHVKKGDLLFVIDAPRYADALGQAQANIASLEARYVQAQKVARRDLALGDLVATETHEENEAQVATAKAALDAAVAARKTAELNVDRTSVHASVNGIVTNLDLHPGDFVGAGTQALALIDTDSIRIEGYFEETKLAKIQVGDQARIRLLGDDHDIAGRVESISAGIADDQSSSTPNQLRAVTPTFAWVRLAQRIPVRIQVDQPAADTKLIVGRTATVSILPGPRDRR